MKVPLNHLERDFEKLYGHKHAIFEQQKQRYQNLIQKHVRRFKEQSMHLFSSPGRTELSGNHTDHNHGKVLAASVNLDSIAVVSKNESPQVIIYSEGYDAPFEVNLNHLQKIKAEEGTTTALIRGIANRLHDLGYRIGGFKAHITSDILPGSGLSSSASIEVLIATIFNHLFNGGQIAPETIAQIGQFAENAYFGKPCGLMDQMTCAVGGIIAIDFKEVQNPVINKVHFDFESSDFSLVIVNTGGSHADLTEDYASVPEEMKLVAQKLGAQVLRQVSWDEFLDKIPQLRSQIGDRAILRALHFFQENQRVDAQVAALQAGNFEKFLQLMQESGDSSFKWLQNIYTTKNVSEQGVTLALALSEVFIAKIGQGACRVHGGGFAGTIQVFLPKTQVQAYKAFLGPVFGEQNIRELSIRPSGAVQVL